MNIEVDHGKPKRLELPQGVLVLMFVPAVNGEVKLQPRMLEDFMASSTGQTQVSRVSNGLLFSSWTEQPQQPPLPAIMARSDFLPTAITNDQDLNRLKDNTRLDNPDLAIKPPSAEKVIQTLHDEILQNSDVKQAWNRGQIPRFPYYHGVDTSDVQAEHDATKSVAPPIQQPGRRKPPHMGMFNTATKTKQEPSKIAQLVNTIKQNYRQSDNVVVEDTNSFNGFGLTHVNSIPHNNVNSVTAGENPRPLGHMSSTVDCTEVNGETRCRRKSSSCQGSFNCNVDTNGVGQMGSVSSVFQRDRIVPFSPPQTNMNMPTRTTTTTTRRPFVRRRTTPATTTTVATTTLPNRDLQELLTQEVMGMDAHTLADAFMDPMMLGLGTMIALAGAYMAIVIEEAAAASALALAG